MRGNTAPGNSRTPRCVARRSSPEKVPVVGSDFRGGAGRVSLGLIWCPSRPPMPATAAELAPRVPRRILGWLVLVVRLSERVRAATGGGAGTVGSRLSCGMSWVSSPPSEFEGPTQGCFRHAASLGGIWGEVPAKNTIARQDAWASARIVRA